MAQDGEASLPIPHRPWQIIAQELAQETNKKRVAELSHELNRAIEQQQGLDSSAPTDGDARIHLKPTGKP